MNKFEIQERLYRSSIGKLIQERKVGADVARRLGVFAWNPLSRSRKCPGREVILVVEWSRDCDCAESTTLHAYPANTRTYMQLEERMEQSAEGPWSLTIVTADEAKHFVPERRDRVLEAFENGSNYVV